MSLNVGILYYNAVFRGLPHRPWDPFTWLAARAPSKACKSWAAQNLAIYAQIGEQRSVLESGPFACCMSKSERIARQGRCARLEGRRTGRRGRPPDQASEWCTKQSQQRHNFLQRLIRSCPLVAPLSVRSPASFTLRSPLPLSGPSVVVSPLLPYSSQPQRMHNMLCALSVRERGNGKRRWHDSIERGGARGAE